MHRDTSSAIMGFIRRAPLVASVRRASAGSVKQVPDFQAENALVAAGDWAALAEARSETDQS
ncbi:MAG: hypothetical protein AAFT19_03255, partial [Pseudomonadota bacterium]